ncbi:MAG TPA: UbiD family decarboxylase [Syntrophorhabdales bacterium]|nr:UbiD family decarboxylase [Syntrophorhabdales bacterium]
MVVWNDLRGWLSEVEKIGELVKINEPTDWDEEISGLTYLVGKKQGGPALLFDNIKGYPQGHRVLSNVLGSSLNRIALALGLPLNQPMLEMIRATKDIYKNRIPPKIVDSKTAPVNENIVSGDDVDITKFPAPKMWPHDGGRYIGTADVVITKDPESGFLNLGTYRQMIMNEKQVGFYVSPGKDALLHREKWWQQGKPCEVIAAYGIDPAMFICGAMGFAKNVSEYEAIGGIMGRPVEVCKGIATDLFYPANAEIVIEGISYPDKLKEEGPFGEFQGYYGRPGGPTPVIDIKAIHYRNNPILTSALMADHPSCEQNLFFGIARSAKIWDDLQTMGIPGIQGVYSVPCSGGGFGMVCVSIEQRYPGHAAQTLAIAAQCSGAAYYTKWVVVVDEDVDPTDIEQVIWAMSTRCDPEADIDLLRQTWSTYLDPTKNPPEERIYGSKALINACKQHKFLKTFSKRTRLTKATYEKVQKNWNKYGLPFDVPVIQTFEPDM